MKFGIRKIGCPDELNEIKALKTVRDPEINRKKKFKLFQS